MGPRGSAWPGGDVGQLTLEGQFVAQQRGLRGCRCGSTTGTVASHQARPRRCGCCSSKLAPASVHARQHGAHLRGVSARGLVAVAAGQARHHRGGLAAQRVHQARRGVGLRRRHRDAVRRQVLHQRR
jgi:hypothetical protein